MFGLSKVEKAKGRFQIDELIRSYGIELKRNGQGLVGCCPFHEDDTPSLRVSPDKGLFNCFGCEAGGSVIDFVSKIEGITVQAAIDRLSNGFELPERGSVPSVREESLLRDVVWLYHDTFLGHGAAQAYLESRGLRNREHWQRFGIGFADGRRLKAAVPASGPVQTALREMGLLNEKGNESFYKSVTFPLRDETGNVVGLYGRSIEGDRQLYLKGPRRGLFNAKTSSSFSSVILTESVIDALSLIELGQANVLPLYGTQGLTSDHVEFIERHGFREVVLCLDNDEAGARAVERLQGSLGELVAKVSVIDLPDGVKDPNDFLRKGGDEAGFEVLLERRRVVRVAEAVSEAVAAPSPRVERTEPSSPEAGKAESSSGNVFEFGAVTYRVRGFSGPGPDHLRLVLTAEREGKRYTDKLDLYVARARQGFAAQVARKLEVQEGKVEDDLQVLTERLEEGPLKREAEDEGYEMSAAERREALSLLKRPDLLERIVQDIGAIGYVGQDREKLLLYLSATSRIRKKPLHVSLRSTSSGGKSEVMEKVAGLFPPESVQIFSRITPQALYYMESIRNKLLVLDERSGIDEGAEVSLRLLMSQGKLNLGVPQRNPKTGEIRTVQVELMGPCVVWDASTENPTEDNRNRMFEVWLAESPDQTRRIHRAQNLEYSPEGWKRTRKVEKIRRVHQNAQRLLRPLRVEIPFANDVEFPAHVTRTHRDHSHLLSLVAVIALLHQHQREVRRTRDGEEYIEATVEDYVHAYRIVESVLRNAYSHVPKEAQDLFGRIHREVEGLAGESGVSSQDYAFSRRQVREWTNWSEPKVRRCLGELVRMEYVQPMRRNSGRGGYRYALNAGPEDLVVPMSLTTPEELKATLKKRSGKC